MFQSHVNSVIDPIAGSDIFDNHRPTAGVLLVTSDRKGVLLAHHVNAPAHAYIPIQQEIRQGETLLNVTYRAIREQVPGVRVDMNSLQFLGDCVNEMPIERGDLKDKWFFWVVAPCMSFSTKQLGEELDELVLVYSPEQLEDMLRFGTVRRKKREMIVAAVNEAYALGMLSWRCITAVIPNESKLEHAVL